MSDSPRTKATVDALQFLISSDVPAGHKRVLIEAVTQALRMQQQQDTQVAEDERESSAAWQVSEEQELSVLLQGKAAKSWQHADETVQRVANHLQRESSDVRNKATELGYGVSVNYALAKAVGAAREADAR
jgi:hypothetical protein